MKDLNYYQQQKRNTSTQQIKTQKLLEVRKKSFVLSTLSNALIFTGLFTVSVNITVQAKDHDVHLSKSIGMDILTAQSTDVPFISEATKRGGLAHGQIAAHLVRMNNAQQNNERLKVNTRFRVRQGALGSVPIIGSPLNAVFDTFNDAYDTALANTRRNTTGVVQNSPVNADFIDKILPAQTIRQDPLYPEMLIEAKRIAAQLGDAAIVDVVGSAELLVLEARIAAKLIPKEVLEVYKNNTELGAQGAYDEVRNNLEKSLEDVTSGRWDKLHAANMINNQDNDVLKDLRNNVLMQQWERITSLADSTDANNPATQAIKQAAGSVRKKLQHARDEGKSEQQIQILKLQLQKEFTADLERIEQSLKEHYKKSIDELEKTLAKQSPKLNFLRQNLDKPQYAGGRQLWSDKAGEIAALGRGVEAAGQLLIFLGVNKQQSSKITNGMYATLHIADGVMALQQTLALKKNQNLKFEESFSGVVGGIGSVLAGINLLVELSQDPAEDPMFAMLKRIMEQLDQVMLNQELLASGQQDIRQDIAQLERVTLYQYELLRTAIAETRNSVHQRNDEIMQHVSNNAAQLKNMLTITQEQVRLTLQTDLVQKLRLEQLGLEQLTEQNASQEEITNKAKRVISSLRDVTNLLILDKGPEHRNPTALHSNSLSDIEAANQLTHSVYQKYIALLLPQMCSVANMSCQKLQAQHTRQLLTDVVQSLLDTAVLMHHEELQSQEFSVQFQEALERTNNALNSVHQDGLIARNLLPTALETYRLLLLDLRNRVLRVSRNTAQAQLEPSLIHSLKPVSVLPPKDNVLAGKLKDYRIVWKDEDGLHYGVERNKLQQLLTSQSTKKFTQPMLSENALDEIINEENRYEPLAVELQFFAMLLLQKVEQTPINDQIYLRILEQMESEHQAFKEQSGDSGIFEEHLESFENAFDIVGGWLGYAFGEKSWNSLWRYLEQTPPTETKLRLAEALRSAQLNNGEQNTIVKEMSQQQHQEIMISANIAQRQEKPATFYTGEQASLPWLKIKYSKGNSSTWKDLNLYYQLRLDATNVMLLKPNNAKKLMEGHNVTHIDNLSLDKFLPNITSVKDARSVFEYGNYSVNKAKVVWRNVWQIPNWHTSKAWEMYDIIPATKPDYAPKFHKGIMMPVKKPKFTQKVATVTTSKLPGGISPVNLPKRPGGVRRLFDGVNEARQRLKKASHLEQTLAQASMLYARKHLTKIWNDRSQGGSVGALPYVSEKHRTAVIKATNNLPATLLAITKARLGVQKLMEIGYGNDCIARNQELQDLYRLIYDGTRGTNWKRIGLNRSAGDTHSDVLVAAENLDMLLLRLEQKDLLPLDSELSKVCKVGDLQIDGQIKLLEWLYNWHNNGADVMKLTRGNALAAMK